ncbi:MAG: hypothetical protein, partial [Olavius algarvensis Gamma 3 endosymbiont]
WPARILTAGCASSRLACANVRSMTTISASAVFAASTKSAPGARPATSNAAKFCNRPRRGAQAKPGVP